MTVQQLTERPEFTVLNTGNQPDMELTRVFTCDLLSVCMSKASAGCAWVTVMGNMNAVAVAVLTDTACIILAEGTPLDANGLAKAQQQGVTVLQSDQPVFETALLVHQLIHA